MLPNTSHHKYRWAIRCLLRHCARVLDNLYRASDLRHWRGLRERNSVAVRLVEPAFALVALCNS